MAEALFDPADHGRTDPQRSTPAGLNGPAGAFGVRRAAYGRSFDTDLETLGVATKRDRHKLAYETGLKGGSVIPGDCLEHDTTDVRIVAATMRPGDKDSDAKRIHRRVKRGIKKGTKSPRGPDFTESRCVYDRRRSDSSVDELVVAARRLTQASRSAQGLLPAVEDVVTIRAVAALLAPARDAPATEVHLRAAESRSLPRRPGKAK